MPCYYWCSRHDSNAELGIRNPSLYPAELRVHNMVRPKGVTPRPYELFFQACTSGNSFQQVVKEGLRNLLRAFQSELPEAEAEATV